MGILPSARPRNSDFQGLQGFDLGVFESRNLFLLKVAQPRACLHGAVPVVSAHGQKPHW